MEEKNGGFCDLETGICGEGEAAVTGFIDLTAKKNKKDLENAEDCEESTQN